MSRNALRTTWRALGTLMQDRHDAVTWLAVLAVTGGVWDEFGRGWAAIAFGCLLFAIAWKGIR